MSKEPAQNTNHPWDADSIRKARKRHKLTQAELAKLLGARQQTVSEWEIGLYGPKNAYQQLLTITFATLDRENPEVAPQAVAQ